MKLIIALLFSLNTYAGLPPTSSKISGESVFSTTFKTDLGTLKGTRSGTTLTINSIGDALGDSLALGGALTAGTIFSASSTTQAIIGPRMTTAQKNAITPVAGMEVFDSTLGIKQYYNGTQWIANTSIQLDNVYSAQISSTGVISAENKDWLSAGPFTPTGTSNYAITFNSGIFTTTPNCWTTIQENAGSFAVISTKSSTGVTVITYSDASANVARAFSINCQKTGADYQSADAYIASNGNYSRIVYTPTLTGFGTESGVSCYHSRDGEFLEVDCKFTSGTPTATEARLTLPSGLTSSSAGAIRIAGAMIRSTSTANAFYPLIEPSTTYFTFGLQGASSGGLTKQNGDSMISSGQVFSFFARIPIQGWTNSNLIVASLAGTPNVPGLTTAVDTFSVSYGTTNVNTACTASPCSFLDQVGTAVTSVTRSSIGAYSINTVKTYSKLKCTGNAINPGVDTALIYGTSGVLNCSNCSALIFQTSSRPAGSALDTAGTIDCKGSY